VHCVAAADVSNQVLVVQGVSGTRQLGADILHRHRTRRTQSTTKLIRLNGQSGRHTV
jgi:hypothetical protein